LNCGHFIQYHLSSPLSALILFLLHYFLSHLFCRVRSRLSIYQINSLSLLLQFHCFCCLLLSLFLCRSIFVSLSLCLHVSVYFSYFLCRYVSPALLAMSVFFICSLSLGLVFRVDPGALEHCSSRIPPKKSHCGQTRVE